MMDDFEKHTDEEIQIRYPERERYDDGPVAWVVLAGFAIGLVIFLAFLKHH